jgi:hypothetical protein
VDRLGDRIAVEASTAKRVKNQKIQGALEEHRSGRFGHTSFFL